MYCGLVRVHLGGHAILGAEWCAGCDGDICFKADETECMAQVMGFFWKASNVWRKHDASYLDIMVCIYDRCPIGAHKVTLFVVFHRTKIEIWQFVQARLRASMHASWQKLKSFRLDLAQAGCCPI